MHIEGKADPSTRHIVHKCLDIVSMKIFKFKNLFNNLGVQFVHFILMLYGWADGQMDGRTDRVVLGFFNFACKPYSGVWGRCLKVASQTLHHKAMGG